MMQTAAAATERLFNFGPPFQILAIWRAAHVIAATGTAGRQPERLRGDALDSDSLLFLFPDSLPLPSAAIALS